MNATHCTVSKIVELQQHSKRAQVLKGGSERILLNRSDKGENKEKHCCQPRHGWTPPATTPLFIPTSQNCCKSTFRSHPQSPQPCTFLSTALLPFVVPPRPSNTPTNLTWTQFLPSGTLLRRLARWPSARAAAHLASHMATWYCTTGHPQQDETGLNLPWFIVMKDKLCHFSSPRCKCLWNLQKLSCASDRYPSVLFRRNQLVAGRCCNTFSGNLARKMTLSYNHDFYKHKQEFWD